MALRILRDRGPDGRARDALPRLGPYETAYDVRRGYDVAPRAARAAERRGDRVDPWMGRRAGR